MNAERQIQAKNIRDAINHTTDELRYCRDRYTRKELLRHLTRLHDIEYAILSMVKFEALPQEEEP